MSLLYGDSDWMDATAGVWLARELRTGRLTELLLVRDAGHQMLLDNPKAFNAACLKLLASPEANLMSNLYEQVV